MPDPVLIGDERHPPPGRTVLQSDRACSLEVLLEGAPVETVKVVRELEVDVQLLTALERVVDRLHHLAELLAGDLAGSAKPDCSWRQIGDVLDQRRESRP